MHFYLNNLLLLCTICLGLNFDILYRNALKLKPDLFEGKCSLNIALGYLFDPIYFAFIMWLAEKVILRGLKWFSQPVTKKCCRLTCKKTFFNAFLIPQDLKEVFDLAYGREKRMPRMNAEMLFPEWMSKRMMDKFIDRWSVE